MAKKRRRKPGLQRCSICGSYQLVQELERGVCLPCLGLVGVKHKRPKVVQAREEIAAAEPVVLKPKSA
jgi:hypothetical protein